MAKRKKDAPVQTIATEASKKKPARFKATAEEARKRTDAVKQTFVTMGKLWWELGAEVKACVDDFVPEALGKKATEWFKECFGDSWLKVYRAHRAVAALPGIPKAKLEKISEGNAYQLARLPKQFRGKEEWIEKAIKLPNDEFKEVVEKKRTPKGFKRDPMVKWNDIFRITSVPKTLAKMMEDALKLAGKNGEFDLDTKEGRINAIELIFSEFVTSQVGSFEGGMAAPDAEQEPGSEIPTRSELEQFEQREYAGEDIPVEETQRPVRRRKASAAD